MSNILTTVWKHLKNICLISLQKKFIWSPPFTKVCFYRKFNLSLLPLKPWIKTITILKKLTENISKDFHPSSFLIHYKFLKARSMILARLINTSETATTQLIYNILTQFCILALPTPHRRDSIDLDKNFRFIFSLCGYIYRLNVGLRRRLTVVLENIRKIF